MKYFNFQIPIYYVDGATALRSDFTMNLYNSIHVAYSFVAMFCLAVSKRLYHSSVNTEYHCVVCTLTGGVQFPAYDTYTYTHQGQFQYDDSQWVDRYGGLLITDHCRTQIYTLRWRYYTSLFTLMVAEKK